jgi:hypothetical protein
MMVNVFLLIAQAASDHLVDVAQGALIVQAVAGIIAMVGIVAIGRRFLATEFPNFTKEIHDDLARLEAAVRNLEVGGARLSETDLHLERRLSNIEGEMRALRTARRSGE